MGHTRIRESRPIGGAALGGLGAVLLALAGCETLGLSGTETSEGETAKLAASAKSPFPDVPVPEGFQLVLDRSGDYVDTQNRVAWHEYVGQASVHAVRDFYRQKLATWKWLVDMRSFGETYLVFQHEFVNRSTGQKGYEWCWLNIKQDGRQTRLRMTITPAPRSPD